MKSVEKSTSLPSEASHKMSILLSQLDYLKSEHERKQRSDGSYHSNGGWNRAQNEIRALQREIEILQHEEAA